MFQTEEIDKKLGFVKQRHFEQANKPGWFLVHNLKKEIEKRTIMEVKKKRT